jgi:hypothetical protein
MSLLDALREMKKSLCDERNETYELSQPTRAKPTGSQLKVSDSSSNSFVSSIETFPFSKCCLCGGKITEPRLTHWWGGEPCHGVCGETAFDEARTRGAYAR